MEGNEYRLLDSDGDTVYEATESTLDATGLDIIVEQWGLADREAKKAQDRVGRWGFYLKGRMEAIAATESVGGAYTAKLEPGTSWDQKALLPLLETEGVTTEELVKDGAVVLSHTPEPKVVPTVFNITRLKKYIKRGGRVKALIEGAKGVTPATLKLIKPK